MSQNNITQAVSESLNISPTPTQDTKPKKPVLMARIYIPEHGSDCGKKGFTDSLPVIRQGTHGLECCTSNEKGSPATEWFANKHIVRTYILFV